VIQSDTTIIERMKLFVPFSIGLLSLLRLSAGHEGSAHPEIDEDYWSYKFKMIRPTDWGVYHFHGKDQDSYFYSSRVALHVSAFKQRDAEEDCGMGTQLQRPIMKTTSRHKNGYIYAQIKASDHDHSGELHLHDFVQGKVHFFGNVKAVKACDKTNEGPEVCEPECEVKTSGDHLGNGYYTKITIKNKGKKTGSLPCGMHIKSGEKKKGKDIGNRSYYSKDHFQKNDNIIEYQPQNWLYPKELWCLDRDCENRAKTVKYITGHSYPLDCTDMNYGPCSYSTGVATCEVQLDQ